MDPDIIGIDIGNSYICFGVWKNNSPEILENDFFKRLMPSYVSYAPNGKIFVGELGKQNCLKNINNTDYDIKRGLNKKKIGKDYYQIFKKIKEIVEKKYKIKRAVLSVPEYFKEEQIKILVESCEKAQMNVIGLVNDTICSALTYAYNADFNLKEKNLIFDFGGSSLKMSVVEINNSNIKNIKTVWDDNLGGIDFDQRIYDFVSKKIEEQENITITEGSLEKKLKFECEKAKLSLSFTNETVLSYEYNIGGVEGKATYELKKARLERECNALFERVEGKLKELFEEIDKNEIKEIILIGGSSRIPKVQKILEKFFERENLCQVISFEESVCSGCIIYSAKLSLVCNNLNIQNVDIPIVEKPDNVITINENNDTNIASDQKNKNDGEICENKAQIDENKTKLITNDEVRVERKRKGCC